MDLTMEGVMGWIDEYLLAYPMLECGVLERMIREERPLVFAELQFDLEEYLCARRAELEEQKNERYRRTN